MEFTAYKVIRVFSIYKRLLQLFATTLPKFEHHHAAIRVSKFALTNYCSVQLLADKRCRWLNCQCHLLRLMRKKRKKKKLKYQNDVHKKSKATFSTIFLHYYCLRTTQPVIISINNKTSVIERCNDCKVIKLFKKRRK